MSPGPMSDDYFFINPKMLPASNEKRIVIRQYVVSSDGILKSE